MPQNTSESDNITLTQCISNLENKIGAQNQEISALKDQISVLISIVTKWNEGTLKCTSCAALVPPPDRASVPTAASASETEQRPSTSAGGCKQVRTRAAAKREANVTATINVASAETPGRTNKTNKSMKKPTAQKTATNVTKEVHQVQPLPNKENVGENTTSDTENGWQLVSNKRHNQRQRRPVVRCSGEASDLLSAADNIKYIHLWGARPGTTVDSVVSYLNKTKTSNLYKVTMLVPKHPQDYASFKVGVPGEMIEECLQEKFWPTGLSVDRWLFRLERNASKETK